MNNHKLRCFVLLDRVWPVVQLMYIHKVLYTLVTQTCTIHNLSELWPLHHAWNKTMITLSSWQHHACSCLQDTPPLQHIKNVAELHSLQA